ncbi:MAG TPA: dolichyl-phosphate beta-glucosyltransferase [Anaerolineales bacterium]|nr:dolichyl-phosphate beta-glucosyltransferase [Anaerolineales bacterium]
MTIFLSVIIPAHNEENRLPNTLEQVIRFLEKQSFTSEVIVVENGSTDRTFDVAQRFAEQYKQVRVMQSERGKGAAVRHGMLEAHGEYRFMCDADLSMPVEEISKFLPAALENFDIAIASREAKGSVRYNEPFYRHLGGRGINFLIQVLILPGLNDTQCGFKCFRADVAKRIFKLQTLPGWSFDIEVLYIARRFGYRVHEVPIHWYHHLDTKIRALPDAIRMFQDIFLIRANARRGMYDEAH